MNKLYKTVLLCVASFTAFAQAGTYRHGHVNTTFTKTYDPRSDSIDILKYTINLDITDITGRKIKGFTKIKFNPKVNNIHYLRVDLLHLNIDSIVLNGNPLSYHYNDTLLSINLDANYQTTDTLEPIVYYQGIPKGDPTGWGGFYFQSGYAYNLGVGFGSDPHVYGRVWFPCFDNFMERSKYECTIKTSPDKSAYCGGELVSDVRDINNNRIRTWVLNEEIPTYLASVAVGSYVDVKMNHVGLEKNIPIVIAALAGDTNNVKASSKNLKDAIRIYEELFGPYAWNKVGYSAVPFTQGAMEHATNIAFPKSIFNGTTSGESILVHELSHHWFGDLITCSSQEEMWLNEGWASYCEHIFNEFKYGRQMYEDELYRFHDDLLHFVRYSEGDISFDNIPWEHTYGTHVYIKGAVMAHNLRGYMGDSLFFSSLKKALAENAFKSITNDQFEQSLSQASGLDLSYFFNDWIKQPGWPHFAIDSFEVSKFNLQYKAKVNIRQKKYGSTHFHQNVPMEIKFIARNGQEYTTKLILSGEYTSAEIIIPIAAEMVVLNPRNLIAQAISYNDVKITKNGAGITLPLAKMELNVSKLVDSAMLRIEHHYVEPSGNWGNNINRISKQRYWTVDGILPSEFKTSSKIAYDGRTGIFSGNAYLDHLLNITQEDSVLLLYRKDESAIWEEYPYYKKEMGNNTTNKLGFITIDSLALGQYCIGIGKSNFVGLNTNKKRENIAIEIFPNPANKSIEIKILNEEIKNILKVNIFNSSGAKSMSVEKNDQNNPLIIDVSNLSVGTYTVNIELKNNKTLSKSFIITR